MLNRIYMSPSNDCREYERQLEARDELVRRQEEAEQIALEILDDSERLGDVIADHCAGDVKGYDAALQAFLLDPDKGGRALHERLMEAVVKAATDSMEGDGGY